ncbi:MAG: hypothetical protein ACE5DI_06145 [Candidatus Micrarchaeia archaeon]
MKRRRIKISEFLKAPSKKLGLKGMRTSYCALYARLAAKELFDLEYKPADAWKFHEENKAVWMDKKNSSPWEKKLKPGRIIGIKYPLSQHNDATREWTHLALYLGEKNKKSVILHMPAAHPKCQYLKDYLGLVKGKVRVVFDAKGH